MLEKCWMKNVSISDSGQPWGWISMNGGVRMGKVQNSIAEWAQTNFIISPRLCDDGAQLESTVLRILHLYMRH